MNNKRVIKSTIVVLAFMAIALTGLLVYGTKNNGNFLIVRGNAKIQKQQTLSLNQCDKINVNLSSDNVEIQTTDNPELKIVQTAYNKINDKDKFTATKNGNEINVTRDSTHEFKVSFLFDFRINEKVTIYIPKNYDKDLSIKVSSGNIKFLSDIKLNELECNGSSGNIDIKNEISAKKVVLSIKSGSEKIEKLKTDVYDISSSSGSIDIKSLDGSGKIDVTSGYIKVKYSDIKEYSNVQADSGSVKLLVPSDLSLEFDGHCSSGNIKSDFDINKYNDGRDASGKLGEGPYKKITTTTHSGNISISKW